ncbi:MAG: hypothetical protein WCI18_14810 [Pseudomonadota bacterium]
MLTQSIPFPHSPSKAFAHEAADFVATKAMQFQLHKGTWAEELTLRRKVLREGGFQKLKDGSKKAFCANLDFGSSPLPLKYTSRTVNCSYSQPEEPSHKTSTPEYESNKSHLSAISPSFLQRTLS